MTDENILIGVDYAPDLDVNVEWTIEKLEDGTFKILNYRILKRNDPTRT